MKNKIKLFKIAALGMTLSLFLIGFSGCIDETSKKTIGKNNIFKITLEVMADVDEEESIAFLKQFAMPYCGEKEAYVAKIFVNSEKQSIGSDAVLDDLLSTEMANSVNAEATINKFFRNFNGVYIKKTSNPDSMLIGENPIFYCDTELDLNNVIKIANLQELKAYISMKLDSANSREQKLPDFHIIFENSNNKQIKVAAKPKQNRIETTLNETIANEASSPEATSKENNNQRRLKTHKPFKQSAEPVFKEEYIKIRNN